MSLALIKSFRVMEDPLGPAPRQLEHSPMESSRVSVARIAPVDNGTVCAAGLFAPHLSSYRTLHDSWSRGMSALQWAAILAAVVCAPLSFTWWPLWLGTVAGFVVAIVAGLAKRKPGEKPKEPPPEEPRGSRPKTEVA